MVGTNARSGSRAGSNAPARPWATREAGNPPAPPQTRGAVRADELLLRGASSPQVSSCRRGTQRSMLAPAGSLGISPDVESPGLGSEATGQAVPVTVNSISHVEQFKLLGHNQHWTLKMTAPFHVAAPERSLLVTLLQPDPKVRGSWVFVFNGFHLQPFKTQGAETTQRDRELLTQVVLINQKHETSCFIKCGGPRKATDIVHKTAGRQSSTEHLAGPRPGTWTVRDPRRARWSLGGRAVSSVCSAQNHHVLSPSLGKNGAQSCRC